MAIGYECFVMFYVHKVQYGESLHFKYKSNYIPRQRRLQWFHRTRTQ